MGIREFKEARKATKASKVKSRLTDKFNLESDYQKYSLEKATPDEMKILKDWKTTLDSTKITENNAETLYLIQKNKLETWSESYGTMKKKASDIMRDYKELAANAILIERKKKEDKEEEIIRQATKRNEKARSKR